MVDFNSNFGVWYPVAQIVLESFIGCVALYCGTLVFKKKKDNK